MRKILIILFGLVLITGCGGNKETTELIKVNQNDNIIKEQVVSNLTLNNTTLYYEKGVSTFNVKINNNSENNINISSFKIIFKNQNGTIITTLMANDINEIKSHDNKNVLITSDIDLSNAYSVEYEIK